MKTHNMNEYQCPYCLYGESERERLLTHLLNCHPGRPGKVLLRRQISNKPDAMDPIGHRKETMQLLEPPKVGNYTSILHYVLLFQNAFSRVNAEYV